MQKYLFILPLYLLVYFELHTIGWRLPANRNIYKLFILLTCVFTSLFRKRTQGVPQGMTKNRVNLWEGVVEKSLFNMRVHMTIFRRRETQMIVAKLSTKFFARACAILGIFQGYN